MPIATRLIGPRFALNSRPWLQWTLSQHGHLRTDASMRSVDAVAAHFARRDRLACADFMEWFDDCRLRSRIHRAIHSLRASRHRVHAQRVRGAVAAAGRPGLEAGRSDRHAAG